METERKHYHKHSRYLAEPRELPNKSANVIMNEIGTEAVIYQKCEPFLRELRKHKDIPTSKFYELRRMALSDNVDVAFYRLRTEFQGV